MDSSDDCEGVKVQKFGFLKHDRRTWKTNMTPGQQFV